jgi:methionyl-tRNA formyltransferase
METKVLLLAGNDKMSHKLVSEAQEMYSNMNIAIDKSLGILKVIKLLFKRNNSVTLFFLLNSLLAEILRKKYYVANLSQFKKESDLNEILKKVEPDLIIVYKGSHIFSKSIIEKFKIINIHCSDTSFKNYRGLGSIYKSFKDKEINPKVTVHEIVTKIDAGKILFTKNYKFDFGKSYQFNENIAYDAGIDCFFEIVTKQ